MINVLVPLRDGHGLHPEVYSTLALQSVPCCIVPISRQSCKHPPLIGGSEMECRNLLRRYATGDFCVLMDSDVVCTSRTDVSDCIDALQTHPEVDGYCHNTKQNRPNKGGIMAFTVIRSSVVQGYEFVATSDHCCCVDFFAKLRIKYLDNRLLREVAR